MQPQGQPAYFMALPTTIPFLYRRCRAPVMSRFQKRFAPRTRPAKPVRYLPLLSRVVLFFTPFRRKVLGFAGLAATWLVLGLFPDAGPWHPAVLAREAAGAAAAVFAVVLVAAELRRPLALPQEQMLRRARERYAKEESWLSPRHPEQVLDAVVRAFGGRGARAVRIGDSVVVEVERSFGPPAPRERWKHADAARFLKFRPAVLVFAGPIAGGPGALVSAFSQDSQRTGMYDVLSLADEMTAAVVERTRAVTGAETSPGRSAGQGSLPDG